MTGWAMFWVFCIVLAICVEIEHIVANVRERWLAKNGYSYEPEKHCWIKRVNSKKFIGYTGPFPKVKHEFEGLKKSLEQDEKLWVDAND